MDNTFTKRIFFSFFFLFFSVASFAQSISIGSVDAGPYGQGSSIAVPITINDAGGCMQIGNTYKLYLSDASGNFSPGTVIGSYNSFYAPFVNGVIPAGTPAGTGYKVRVISSSPVLTSTTSAAFTVKAATGVTASASCDQNVAPNVFGSCAGADGINFQISGTTPSGVITTASFNNEQTQTSSGPPVLLSGYGYTFSASASNYTVTIKSVDGTGTVGTMDYELVNNYPRNIIGSTGSGFTCLLNDKGPLSFSIDVSSAGGGIQVNYPGNLYKLDWGDGTSTIYTFCQLKAANGIVTHIFTLPSCGELGSAKDNLANAFKVTSLPSSPYCGGTNFADASTTARVLIKPKASFTGPTVACVGTQVTLINTSSPGPVPMNFTSPSCLDNPGALYDWWIDNTKYPNYTLTQPFVLPANLTAGKHTILLHPHPQAGSGVCTADDVPGEICIENPPKPAFTIQSSVCQGSSVSPVDASSTDLVSCTAAHPYTWTVTGPAAVAYAGGTNANSTIPQFVFNTPGTYSIVLTIGSGCGDIPSAPQTINIDVAPNVTMKGQYKICGTGILKFDATAGSPTQTTYSGTTAQGTYAWTVTGGPYTFAGSTSASSQYPQIQFQGYGDYTVSVTHTNSCGNKTASQVISVGQAPVPVVDPPGTICYTDIAHLTSNVTPPNPGSYTGLKWFSTGTGTFTAGTSLNTDYKPSAADIAAGSVKLTLHAYSTFPTPCDDVTSNVVTLTITPQDKITSATSKQICSGGNVNYTITSKYQPNDVINWTASVKSGTATGFTTSGTGTALSDVLINTGTTDAVVTYHIIPTYKGCPGTPLDLSVTVNPLPVLTTSDNIICNKKPTGIPLSSNLTSVTTTYTWTSPITAGITGNTSPAVDKPYSSIPDVLVNSTNAPITLTYTITPHNGTCTGAVKTAKVTVQPSILSDPGNTDEVCSDTYQLKAKDPSPGTGIWSLVSGPTIVTFSDVTKPNASVSNLKPGDYVFKWSVNTPSISCPDENSVTITIDTPPVAGTVNAPVSVCKGDPAIIAVGPHIGTITKWQSSTNGVDWTDYAVTSDTYAIPSLTVSTTYRAVIQSGICDAVYSTAFIKADDPPVPSNPGNDMTICGIIPSGETSVIYKLQGNNPSPGTGKWTLESGLTSAKIDIDNDPNTTVRYLQAGQVYKFRWTTYPEAGSKCLPDFKFVTITVEGAPIAGAILADPVVCKGDSRDLTLQYYDDHILRWESSTDGGTTWTTLSTVDNPVYHYAPLLVPTMFRAWVNKGLGLCPAVPTPPVTVDVTEPTVPSNPGLPETICGTILSGNSSVIYTLQGNNPAPGTGKWTTKIGSPAATFGAPTNPNSTVNLQPGKVYEFVWTTSPKTGSVCATDAKSVVITVEDPAAGGTTRADLLAVCPGDSREIFLDNWHGNSIIWQAKAVGETVFTTVSTANVPSYTYPPLTKKTTFRAEVSNGNTKCTDPVYSTEITIDVNPATVQATADAVGSVCGTTPIKLHGNDPGAGTGMWVVTSGTGLTFAPGASDPNAVVSGLQVGKTYNLSWVITGVSPCGTTSAPITITIDPGPVGGDMLGGANVCAGPAVGVGLHLENYNGTIVRWETSTDNGVTWVDDGNAGLQNRIIGNLTQPQTILYRAWVHLPNTTCPDVASNPAKIVVGQPAVQADAGADFADCNITSYTLKANSPGTGTGKWTSTTGSGLTFVNDNDPLTTVNGLVPGHAPYKLTWTTSGTGTCPVSTDDVMITSDKPAVGGTTTGDKNVCVGDNATYYISLSGVQGTYHWVTSTAGGPWIDYGYPNTPIVSYANLTQTTQFKVIVTSGSCPPQESTVSTVTVAPPAVISVPGQPDRICGSNTTYTLQGNNPGTGTGLWTVAPGTPASIQITNPTSPNAVVNGLQPGNAYTFIWTISTNCSVSANPVTLTVDALSKGGTTSTGIKEYCGVSGSGFITLDPGSYVGTVDHWEQSTNGTDWTGAGFGGINTFPYSGLTTPMWYRAVVKNGTCPDDPSAPTKITVYPPTVQATIQPIPTTCSTDPITLHGNDPGTGTGEWSSVPALTFDNITKPDAQITGMQNGQTYALTWKITGVGTCNPTSATVNFSIDALPTGGTTAGGGEFCGVSDRNVITWTPGLVGTIHHWESSTDGGPWVNIGFANQAVIPYQNLTSTTKYRAMITNGTCTNPVPSTESVVTVHPPIVQANVQAIPTQCSKADIKLQANDPGTGIGEWIYDAATGISVSNIHDPNATVSGLDYGHTYTLTWKITSIGCEPTNKDVTIVIDDLPKAGSLSPGGEFCAASGTGSIDLLSKTGTVDRWESLTEGETQWVIVPQSAGKTTINYPNLTKTTTYHAVVTNGICTQSAISGESKITVYPATIQAAIEAIPSTCGTDPIAVRGTNPGPSTGEWSAEPGSNLTFDDPTNPNTMVRGMVNGKTYAITWTIKPLGNCQATSSTVSFTVYPLSIGGTTSGGREVCRDDESNQGTITLDDGSYVGRIMGWQTKTATGGWISAGNADKTFIGYNHLPETTTYRAVIQSGSCEIKYSGETTITVGQPAIASNPGLPAEVCNVIIYQLHGNNPSPGTGKWTILPGGPAGAQILNDTQPDATVTGMVPGVYQFMWSITGSPSCPKSERSVTITNDAPPIPGTTEGMATVCSGDNDLTIKSIGAGSSIVRWQQNVGSGEDTWEDLYDQFGPTLHRVNITKTTRYRVVVKGQGKCGEDHSTETVITVNPPTVIANAGPDDEVCNVTTYQLKGNDPGAGTGTWVFPDGVTLLNPHDPKATVSGLVPGNSYTFIWKIQGLLPCGETADEVKIKIDQQALGGKTAGAATVCAGDNEGDISLKEQLGTVIKWESLAPGNNGQWQTITDVTIPHHFKGLTETTKFRAIVHIDGKCSDAPSTETTITVNPQTVIADAGQDFTICNTTIAKLNGNSPGPSTGLWVQTAGPTVNIANPASYQTVVSGLAKGNAYTFKWTIKGLASCADTYASVTIGAYEDVTPSFTKTEDHICGTSTVTFTNTSTPSPTGTFEWDFGDGTPVVTAVNPPSHTFVPSPDGREMIYTIRLTPTSNCGLKAPFTDVVKISPQKPVAALVPGQMSYCGTFSLSAKNMSPGENAQYDFYLKDATGAMLQHVRKTDTTTAVFQSITPAAPTVYSIYVVATDKCGNQGNSAPINVSAAPSSLVSGVQIKGDVQSVCLGSPVTFQNISTGGDRFSISIYDASKKLIAALPSGTGDLNYTPKALGKYYVSIIAGSTGCGDAPPSALREFTVSPTPQPRFTYTADNDYNVTFYNNTPDAGDAPASTITYNWDFGDGSVKEGTYIPKTHHYDITKAPYTVRLTATTPGTNCFDVYTNSVELKFHGDLFMPNAFIPTSANRELNTYRVKGYGMKTWHMQIFNNFGQLVWETTKLDANGSPTEGWDGTYKGQIVQQGVYIWQITATLLNGEDWKGVSMNNATPSKTGPIHLIR